MDCNQACPSLDIPEYQVWPRNSAILCVTEYDDQSIYSGLLPGLHRFQLIGINYYNLSMTSSTTLSLSQLREVA